MNAMTKLKNLFLFLLYFLMYYCIALCVTIYRNKINFFNVTKEYNKIDFSFFLCNSCKNGLKTNVHYSFTNIGSSFWGDNQ